MTTRRLFELVTEDGCSISPYVWRSKYALAAKGLAYDRCDVGFVDISSIGSGGFATVPVLQDPNGQWVAESWAIAAYLDDTYPDPPLFSCPGEHALALFFEKWLAVEVVSKLFRICALDIHNRLRKADQAYFRQTREARLLTVPKSLRRQFGLVSRLRRLHRHRSVHLGRDSGDRGTPPVRRSA